MGTPHHFNPVFDRDLAAMDKLLEEMEDAVSAQIAGAQEAFAQKDTAMARSVRKRDKAVNRLAERVEKKVLVVLSRHQPVAEDLRHVIGALKMATEYERCADYVKHLAKSVAKLSLEKHHLEVNPALRAMLDEVAQMFAAGVEARRKGSSEDAARVWQQDAHIDALCKALVREVFANHKRGDGSARSLMHAMSVAKNSERIGDKIKNLMEILHKQKTGDALDVKKGA